MPQSLEFVPRRSVEKNDWDSVVLSSPDGWTWALYDWQDMVLSVAQWRMEELGFAVVKGGQLVAVVPLHYQPGENHLASSGWGWSGPVLAANLSSKQEKKILSDIYGHIRNLGRDYGAAKCLLGAVPVTSRSIGNNWGVSPFTAYGFEDVSSQSLVLDLSQSEEQLWQGLSQDARQQIKKAEKSGYTIKPCSWQDCVDNYYELHCETYARTGVPPHPKAYFEGLAHKVDPQKYAALWSGVSPDGDVVAYHNDCCFGDAAVYMTGCSSQAHMASGVNYLLFWHAILGSKENGRKWYEIGEVFPGAKGNKAQGLSIFKSKFGGTLHRYFKGSLDLDSVLIDHTDAPSLGKKDAVKAWFRSSENLVAELFGRRFANRMTVMARATLFIPRAALRGFRAMGRAFTNGEMLVRRVVFPKVQFIRPIWGDEELSVSDQISANPLQEVESEFRKRLSLPDDAGVVLTGSGRTAIELVLRSLKKSFPERTKVLIPSYGCLGILFPILNAGLTPVYVDIDDDLLPDVDMMTRLIGPDVLVAMFVHLGGKAQINDAFRKTATKEGVIIIDDETQAFGALPWRKNENRISIYSFGIGKSLMATAGGAVIARNFQKELNLEASKLAPENPAHAFERFKLIRKRYFKSHMTRLFSKADEPIPGHLQTQFDYVAMSGFDAKLLLYQLDKKDKIIDGRIANAQRLRRKMQQYPTVFFLQSSDSNVYTKLIVRLADKRLYDLCWRYANRIGVECEHMYIPLHLRDEGRIYADRKLAKTESWYATILNIPVRPDLSARELRRVEKLIDYVGRKGT